MRYPQVLVYENDGRLAEFLRREPGAWSLREPRSLDSCLRLLQPDGPGVLVLKVGKDLLREFTLLDRVTWLFPETKTVVVSQTDSPVLNALAWDLGAACVLLPPQPRPELVEVVSGLLEPAPGLAMSPAGYDAADRLVLEEEG